MINRRIFLSGAAAAAGAFSFSGAANADVSTGQIVRQLAASGQLPDFLSPALFGDAPFPVTLAAATNSLIAALSELYLAIEDRESAEQLALLGNALVGDYGRDELKEAQSGIRDKGQIDLAALQSVSSDEAGSHVRKTTLHSGVSGVYHAIAIDQGRELTENMANSARSIGRGGLGGALGGIRNLASDRRTTVLAQAAITQLPQNLQLARNLYSASREFMQANDLAPPTEAEAQSLLADF